MGYKKQILVVAASLVSTIGFAGTMGTVCTPGNVTTPCEQQIWGVGADALYLKPTFTGFDYTTDLINSGGDQVNYGAYRPSAGWGFKIEGFYHYGTGSDLNLNWYHLDKNSNQTQSVTDLTDRFLGPRPSTNLFKTGWDAVNLEFGQIAQFGETKRIRFHGGLQYAHLSEGYNLNIPLADQGLTPEDYRFNVNYDGVGPRLGVDGSYTVSGGLSIFGKMAGSILVGHEKLNETFTLPPSLVTAFNTLRPVTNFNGSRTQVIPELEGKVGLNYAYPLMNGNIDVDAGWMFVNYFSAYTVPHAGPGASGTSDFALNGPFFGLTWLG